VSFYAMAFLGVAPLGALTAGALAGRIGAQHTLLAGGVCCIGGAFVFWRHLTRFRHAIGAAYRRLGVVDG